VARRLRLTLAYDGTDYHGWQRQPRAETIQGLLMERCARILGEPVVVTGASRTDAGVHALRQVASLQTGSDMAAGTLRRALNATLPAAVRVTAAEDAPAGFDARRHARGKRYAYLIDRGDEADPFLRRFAWHAPQARDLPRMGEALRALRGVHDFSAFCAAPGRDRTPICTVTAARLAARRDRLVILLSADSFLHHMVRNIVGSLVEVGRGARPAAWIGEVLAGRDRRRAGPTAPPHGLALLRVLYRRAA
jgi:tRNA pseudouridine38-40 synthase